MGEMAKKISSVDHAELLNLLNVAYAGRVAGLLSVLGRSPGN